MRITALMLAVALGLPSIAAADNTSVDKPKATGTPSPADPAAKLTDEDVAIIAHLHHVNVMEIDLGKLAQKRGSPAVKRYGEQMVRDHGTADAALVTFAKERGLTTIPEDKPVTEAEQSDANAMAERVAKLKTMKTTDFDREYLAMMVAGHEMELARTDPEIAAATDPALKKLLENRKSMLQRHANLARELQKRNAQARIDGAAPSKGVSAPR